LRIVVHDFGGYDFPADLSRELVRRGHEVLHLYCADVAARGPLDLRPDDGPGLHIEGVTIGHPFEKYSLRRRFADEEAYGRLAAARVRAFDPRVVLSANAPLLSQRRLMGEARRHRRRFVYWWQDSYGIGMREVVRTRAARLAPLAAWPFEALERRMLRASDHVVAISEGLRAHARRWGVDPARIEVIENWAPVHEVAPEAPENTWKKAHGLAGRPLVLYAGTLGLKHDPELLVALANALAAGDTGARMVVVSQGPGRELLQRRRLEAGLENLVLLDYQPHEQVGEMLGAADVLVAILEPGAGVFSVPSKVFAYMSAGRPVVASIPPTNQAAEVLRAAGAGVCVSPGDRDGFLTAVVDLLGDAERRRRLGDSGRAYALDHFAREPIADRIARILAGPRGSGHGSGPLGVGSATVRRIWTHPENRHRRARALATYGAWQVWERTVRRPWTVRLTPTRRIRCHPHSTIGSSVLYFGLPDPMEMRFLLRLLTAGDAFVDVGAHLGVYTVLASSVPGVRVVALEPSTASFARLRENIDLNGIGAQVTAVQVAAGNRCGEARLSTGSDSMNGLVDVGEGGETVTITTVDRLLADIPGTRVAAMKIDVEGLELDVLDGARATIERDRPVIVVEVNDPERVAAFARRNGYTCVRYDPDGHRLLPESVQLSDGRNALLVADVEATRRRLRR
jgi:colanic acid biosynthesis glycosyl transferase WcaI